MDREAGRATRKGRGEGEPMKSRGRLKKQGQKRNRVHSGTTAQRSRDLLTEVGSPRELRGVVPRNRAISSEKWRSFSEDGGLSQKGRRSHIKSNLGEAGVPLEKFRRRPQRRGALRKRAP